MKKYIVTILFLYLCIDIFGIYKFPFKNPYVATILGSSLMMTKDIPKNIPIKEFTLNREAPREIPPNMWYTKRFKFSLSKQKNKAPLIFILSGTGSAYNSEKTKKFQRIFYNAGYHVLTVTSVFHPNFLINISNTGVPGILIQDGLDLYDVMESMLKEIKQNESIEISDVYLTGYSMGATHSAILTYLDSYLKAFKFKRVYLINPSVNLYYSAKVLDNMLFKNIKDKKEIHIMLDNVLKIVKQNMSSNNFEISEEGIYSIFKRHDISNKQMEELIGLAFNLVSIDVNYIVDQSTNMNIYSKKNTNKYESMYPIFKKIDFANFNQYLHRLAYPYYKAKLGYDLKFDDLVKYGSLNIIKNYLEKENKIAVVTNEDDFILSTDDKNFLKQTFKQNVFIYPYGGHCGNMFYKTNVQKMLKFLEKGELNREL